MGRRKMVLTENQLEETVSRIVKRVLKEGTTDKEVIRKWNYLKEYVGSDEMLECVFSWLDSDQIEKLLTWFEQDGYLSEEY